MTDRKGLFSICGFAIGGDHLVFEACLKLAWDDVRHCLDAREISDDPGLVYCYPIGREDVAALTGRKPIPLADFFVNATNGPLPDEPAVT